MHTLHTIHSMPTFAPPVAPVGTRADEAAPDPTQLAARLQDAREQERRHLAREFHDVLGGLLTAARLDLASLQLRLAGQSEEVDRRLQHLDHTLRAAFAVKRRIIDGLAPTSLHGVGLAASLEAMVREFVEASGIHVSTTLEKVAPDEETRLAIYRLVQEALTNIAKYAGAASAEILLRKRGGGIMVTVSDRGPGFDAGKQLPHSHGLEGMRHRVESAGGQLTVESAPGVGTRIRATFPPPWRLAATH